MLHAAELFADGGLQNVTLGAGQWFGLALTAGYYRGGSRAELVVGIPGTDATGVFAAPFDPNATSATRWWWQGQNGLDGEREQSDFFGAALA